MAMNKTITISREYGSGGLETGMMLAKRLGIPLYDRKMVEMAAAEAGLSANVVDDKEEKCPGAFDYRAYLLNCGRPVADRVFFAQSDVIRKLAGQGQCVIVGRCADYVLRDHHECLNIFIHSPLELRVNRVAGRMGCSLEEAREATTTADKNRAAYHWHYARTAWGRAANYHLSIDSSIGLDETVGMIMQLISLTDKK